MIRDQFKKEPVTFRPSDFGKEIWIGIVLINPKECNQFVIPRKGAYVSYKAYFPDDKNKRLFNIVFKYKSFNREIGAINPSERQDLDRPVYFKFKFTKYSMLIKDYKTL